MPISEFKLISRYFAQHVSPSSEVITGIGDDAAVVSVPKTQELVVAIDTLVAGVHFPVDTSPYNIAYKALAVNLSDLAAMGAEPAWFTLALTLPESTETWLEAFSQGLFALANKHNLQLIGGDTTRGPLTVSIQIAGHVPKGQALLRRGAQPGDKICVTGTLGDAALGLKLLQEIYAVDNDVKTYLVERLNCPQPRIAQGLLLRELATACIDISDGLLADLTHMLDASDVGATIYEEKFPVSVQAGRVLTENRSLRSLLLNGGDDYELCFTVPESRLAELESRFEYSNSPFSCIGEITSQSGLRCLDAQGQPVNLAQSGYQHFS